MKCPIKKLEAECIEKECPFYRSGPCRCGLESAADALENIATELSDISASYCDWGSNR